ncbi:S24 family peptidase [Caballeronia sp. INML2]|uniref:S24 family peptidase n=1 Tax=Caballeronia sp. INML2 TaxID=2921748 RepID=UPI0020282180|nr:S24 family peptidase [Caballeronia sp. INML2]
MNTIVYTMRTMSLGKNVKHLRALADIALEPLAEALGLERAAGRQKIYALEKRESRKSDIASDLARYFGFPVERLLSEDLTSLTKDEWLAIRSAYYHSNPPNNSQKSGQIEQSTASPQADHSRTELGRTEALQRVQAAGNSLGLSAIDIAKAANVDQRVAGRWLRGEGDPPTLEQAVALQNKFGINAVWLTKGKGDPGVTVRFADEFQPIPITNWKAIPVVGMAQLGDNGYWADLEYPVGHGEGYVTFPTNDPDAYALRCEGDSMRPRIKAGEFVVVEPNHEIEPGDEVLVKSIDGRVMVKEFLYRRSGRTHLISTNDAHPPVAFTDEEIEKMHYVAGIAKRAMWRPD